MRHYNPSGYEQLHEGITVIKADLKTDQGQRILHSELAAADVLITSFRPSALMKLGLDWLTLHTRYPKLCQVAIVGGKGGAAEVLDHDVTHLAEHELVSGTDLPATLFADTAGSLITSEAVLQAGLRKARCDLDSGALYPEGRYFEVSLLEAAGYLALPRQ